MIAKANNKLNHCDITDEWRVNATPNNHQIKDQMFWLHNNIKYMVDGKNIILDYNKREKETAIWLSNTFGGEIYMLPRVIFPKYVKTSDFLFKNENYDLKTIISSNKAALDNAIRKYKYQSNNFIIDVSMSKLTEKDIQYQVTKIYNNPKRAWVNILIIKKDKKFTVYKRK